MKVSDQAAGYLFRRTPAVEDIVAERFLSSTAIDPLSIAASIPFDGKVELARRRRPTIDIPNFDKNVDRPYLTNEQPDAVRATRDTTPGYHCY